MDRYDRLARSIVVSVSVSAAVWAYCLIRFRTVAEVPLGFDPSNHGTVDRLWDPVVLIPLLFVFGSLWDPRRFASSGRPLGVADWLAVLAIMVAGTSALVVVFVGWPVVWWQSYAALAAIGVARVAVAAVWFAVRAFRIFF